MVSSAWDIHSETKLYLIFLNGNVRFHDAFNEQKPLNRPNYQIMLKKSTKVS